MKTVEFEIKFEGTIKGYFYLDSIDNDEQDVEWLYEDYQSVAGWSFPFNPFNMEKHEESWLAFEKMKQELNENWNEICQYIWDFQDEYKEVNFDSFDLVINPFKEDD